MEKYLLLFGAFLVTWQIQSAAGFPGRFKNSSTSQEGDATGKNAPTIGDSSPEGNSPKESTTDKATTKETTATVTTTEKATTEAVGLPASRVNCNALKSSDLYLHLDDVFNSCNSLKSSDKGAMLKPDIYSDERAKLFNNFAVNLKSIDGVGLYISFTPLKEIDIPKLQDFTNSDGITIASNHNLKYVNIKVANVMFNVSNIIVKSNSQLISFLLRANNSEIHQEIKFLYNAKLAVILLNVYKIIGKEEGPSRFIIFSNSQLESVYLKTLLTIQDVKYIAIVNNHKLKTIDAPILQNINNTSKFEISENRNLVNLTFPTITFINAKQIVISKNDRLGSIIMKRLWRGYENLYATILSIGQNRMLTTIDIDMNVLIRMNLNIRGNPKLDKNWLKDLRKLVKISTTITNITIQMDGECIFEDEIEDLSELDDCLNIFGNLTLAENVNGTWNAHIDTITGDTDFANYPLWEIKGTINHQGKVYSNRCDGPASNRVIRIGCVTEPPSVEKIENITTTTKAPQALETFGLEDYEFDHNMVDPVTPARSAWLSEWDTTAIFLVIFLGAFFAFLIYLYHCRRDENMQRANLPEGLTRIDDDSLSGLEIFAAEMAQPPFERASSSSDSAITGKSNNSEGSSTASHSTKPATDKSTKPATERSQPSATTKSMSNKAPSDSSTTMSTKPQAESSHDVSTSQSNK